MSLAPNQIQPRRPEISAIRQRSPAQLAWKRFFSSRAAQIGLVIIGTTLLLAVFADWITPYGKNFTANEVAESPSRLHWLGTDSLRKDVLSRVIFGSRLSLLAGLISIGLAMAIGVPIGAIAGYAGGRTDSLLMRAIDVALAFPSILIALLLMVALQPGWTTVVLAVGLINVPIFARQVRASVLTISQLDYVLAAKAMGAGNLHIILWVVLPALVGPLVVLASLSIGSAILEVAGLSFLGVGGDPTEPEWGSMLSQAKGYWSKNAWFALGPGGAISLTVLGFNLLGDGIRDALDPRTEET